MQNRPVASLLTFLLLASSSCGKKEQTGIDVLGTHYSRKLADLIAKVERESHKKIRFKEKEGAGDDTSYDDDGRAIITMASNAPEDDVAHELTHVLLKAEEYPWLFGVPGARISESLGPLIASDLDHLIINQREKAEGYDPVNGFLRPVRPLYRTVLDMRLTQANPEAIGTYRVSIMHELMRFVFYVSVPESEPAILGAHPDVTPFWNELKPLIERYIRSPSPSSGWHFANEYRRLMDHAFFAARSQTKFSDYFGFKPLPIARADLKKSAGAIFRVVANPIVPGVQGILQEDMMIGLGKDKINLDVPVEDFCREYEIPLRIE